MKQNNNIDMNREVPKQWKVPRYSDKYKDVLQRAYQRQKMQEKHIAIQQKPAFFYRVKSIGVGAFSFVYLVIQQNSGALFAQKAIHKKKISQSLFTEIKLHLTLTHSNIITLHHIYSEEEYIYLIMDYAGDSLFTMRRNHMLPSKILSSRELQPILSQLAQAIKYLHDRDIVHGDIKLENILMLEGCIKLCDMGLAEPLKASNGYGSSSWGTKQQKQVVGTFEYLSPEYVQGKSAGKERDIWAFGIVCYQLYFGKNPLDGIPQNEKWSKMLSISHIQLPTNDPTIPAQIRQFLENTLCEQQNRMTIDSLLKLPLIDNFSPKECESSRMIQFQMVL